MSVNALIESCTLRSGDLVGFVPKPCSIDYCEAAPELAMPLQEGIGRLLQGSSPTWSPIWPTVSMFRYGASRPSKWPFGCQ